MVKKDDRLIRGVCPILTTAFFEDGGVDMESTLNLVQMMLDAGVDGIALFGNASEGYALLQDEKRELHKAVREFVGGRVPLIVSSGSTGLEGAVHNSVEAQENGADALMIMPPYMIKPDGQRMYDYFAAIARAVSVPIMLQDAPGACGVAMPLDVIARLVEEFDTVKYIKAESPPTITKIAQIKSRLGDSVSVFGGLNGIYYYEELVYGIDGIMPAGEFPEVFVRIQNAFERGGRDTARELFYRYLPYIRIGTLAGNMAMSVHKQVLREGGVFQSDYVRNPNVPIDDSLREIVLECAQHLDLMALSYKEKV